MPFNAFARHRPSRKAYHRRNAIPWLAMASDCRRATDECELPPLDIGVRAMQLSPYRTGVAGPYHTRLLLRPASQPCSCPLALSGPGQAVASKSSALNFGLLWRRFIPCVTWRTVSSHPAQAWKVVFQKWRWTEINVTLGLIFVASHRKEWPITFIAVRCPHCQSDQIVKRGNTA